MTAASKSGTSSAIQGTGIPKYSVIVPAYNAHATLPALLDSLEAQTFRDFEVIVVDDASTDGAASEAVRPGIRHERLPERSGPATARNTGARLAHGDWLVFADADMVFLPSTLEQIDLAVTEGGFDALVGGYAGVPANAGFMPVYKGMWEWVTVERRLAACGGRYVPLSSWAPRPGAVRRAAFQAVGGFNERFKGADLEDMDFGYRLRRSGFRIMYCGAVRARHHYPLTLSRELRSFARRAFLWARMRKEYPRFDAEGEGSIAVAACHTAGLVSFVLWLTSAVWRPAWIGALVCAAVYIALNGRFLVAMLRERGPGSAACAILVCWLHSLVLGIAAGAGFIAALVPETHRNDRTSATREGR